MATVREKLAGIFPQDPDRYSALYQMLTADRKRKVEELLEDIQKVEKDTDEYRAIQNAVRHVLIKGNIRWPWVP